jgi:hypothetical protein
MSGQAQGGPSAPKDDNKEKRFSRLLTRAKTVFNKKTDGKGTKSKPVTVPHSATITTAPDTAPVVKQYVHQCLSRTWSMALSYDLCYFARLEIAR